MAVLPDAPPNASWGWLAWGPYKERSILILTDVQPGETRTVDFALRTGPGNISGVSPETVADDEYVVSLTSNCVLTTATTTNIYNHHHGH